MKNFSKIIAISILLLGTSCATRTIKLEKDSAAKINGKSLELSGNVGNIKELTIFTPWSVIFGPIIGYVAFNNDDKQDFVDPSNNIKEQIAKTLQKEYKLSSVIKNTAKNEKIGNVGDILKQYNKGDLVLVAYPSTINSVYYPLKWSTYKVLYSVNVRLIDRKSAAVIAGAMCTYDSDTDFKEGFNRDELRKDSENLEKILNKAEEYCVPLLVKEMM